MTPQERDAMTTASHKTRIRVGKAELPDVVFEHLSAPQDIRVYGLKSLGKKVRALRAPTEASASSGPPALFSDLLVETSDILPTDKTSIADWNTLSISAQLGSGMLAKTPDYHFTHGSTVSDACFENVVRIASIPCTIQRKNSVSEIAIMNSKNLTGLRPALLPYLIEIKEISPDMCEDLRRIRHSLELIATIGVMPLGVAIYKGRLNTLYDSTDHANHDKGANGAFAAVLAGLGLGSRERPSDEHAKAILCADVVTLITSLCSYFAFLTGPGKRDALDEAQTKKTKVTVYLQKSGKSDAHTIPLDFSSDAAGLFQRDFSIKRSTDGVVIGQSKIPPDPLLRALTTAKVIEVFILPSHLFASPDFRPVDRFIQPGFCHGFREFLFSLPDTTAQRALLRLSGVLLDLSDQSLPRVKLAVRELLGDSCRTSITEMTAGLIGKEIASLKIAISELTRGTEKVFSSFLGLGPLDTALKALDSPALQAGKLEVVTTGQRAIASLDSGLPIFHLIRELDAVCGASPASHPMLTTLRDALIGLLASASVEEEVATSHFRRIRRALARSDIFSIDGTNMTDRGLYRCGGLRDASFS